MTMHLARGLTLIGKKRGKIKFKSAEHKRIHEQLNEDWKNIQAKWATDSSTKKQTRAMTAEVYVPTKTYTRGSTAHIPSRNTGDGIATTKQIPTYTGTKILGIGTLHKSNAVPIFTEEEAHDISKMRR